MTKSQTSTLVAALIAGAWTLALPAAAQTPAAPAAPRPAPVAAAARPAPRPGEVESDPIRCWWKTDRTAVRVGEAFELVLTCGTIETGPVGVVPALTQLEGGAIQLTPFEVVSATRRADILAPPWRYVQFEYAVRLLNDGFFGQDVSIPALTVTYNLKSAGGENAGRDQSYVLPALPMRILSLVPRGASDIRDASSLTFADIEARRFRASAWRIAAAIAAVFAVLFAILALVRFSQRFRARTPAAARPVPAASQLAGCAAVLREAQSDARASGWSPELARRVLPALRVAGATALGSPVAQVHAAHDVVGREGQVVVRTGWLRFGRAVLSASTTPGAITAVLDTGRPRARARASLAQLGAALQAFGSAAYGRQAELDGGFLDRALDDALDAVKRLRVGALWPMRAVHAVSRTFSL